MRLLLQQLNVAVIDGNHKQAEQLTQQLLQAGVDARVVLNEGLMPGMDVVGTRFREGKMFLPQVLVAARAMKASMALLDPLLAASEYRSRGKILLGTVKGDVHDIGKNLVAVMLRGAGFDVVDIGIGCPAEKFIDAYAEHHPDIVGLSALLTTTMVYMKTVIDEFRGREIDVPIIVGGAPVSERFAAEIGAAGYARNASEAVDLVRRILTDER